MSIRRILVIDDDPFLYRIVEALAHQIAGEIDVRPAFDGVGGLALAAELPPELIFLDFRMPDVDGYEVLCTLRANPQTSKIPVIAVSGAISTRGRCAEMIVQCDGYLPKPFAFEQLTQTLRQFLNLSPEVAMAEVASKS